MSPFRVLLAIGLLSFLPGAGSESIAGDIANVESISADSTASLVQAATALRQRLATWPEGGAWEKYLRLAELEAELRGLKASGYADAFPLAAPERNRARNAAAITLGRLEGARPGLDHPTFVSFRRSLARWFDRTGPKRGDEKEIARRFRESPPDVAPTGGEELAEIRGRLRTDLRRLEQFWNTYPAATAQGWKSYAAWENLRRAAKGEPLVPETRGEKTRDEETPDRPADPAAPAEGKLTDVMQLKRIVHRLTVNKPGIEAPPLIAVRESLQDLHDALLRTDPEAKEKLAAACEEISRLLGEFDANMPREKVDQLAAQLQIVREMQGAPAAVRDLRRILSRENVLAEMSREFVATRINRPLYQTDPVVDCILGANVRGSAEMVGGVSVLLRPNPDFADLWIQVNGQAHTSTIGSVRNVAIGNSGVTQVHGGFRVGLTPKGAFPGEPISQCSTETTLESISAPNALVRGIARRRASRQQPLAEEIASSHAEDKVTAAISRQSREEAERLNRRLQADLRLPLLRLDTPPDSLRYSTSNSQLLVRGVMAPEELLAAPGLPPPAVGKYDLEARIHVSAIENQIAALAADRLLSPEDREFVKNECRCYRPPPDELPANKPDEKAAGDDQAAGGIAQKAPAPAPNRFFEMAPRRPVTVVFDEDLIEIRLRLVSYTLPRGAPQIAKRNEKGEIVQYLEMYAKYKLVGGELRRVGGWHLGKGIPRLQYGKLSTFMEKVFKPCFNLDQKVSVRSGGEKHLLVERFEAKQEWLSIGWRLADHPRICPPEPVEPKAEEGENPDPERAEPNRADPGNAERPGEETAPLTP